MKKHLLLVLLLRTFALQGQSADLHLFQMAINKTTEAVKVDGYLQENVWQQAPAANLFWLNAPRDDVKASHETLVWLTYDEKNIYIAAVLKGQKRYMIQTLKRDGKLEDSDAFAVLLDPVGQKTLGYMFAVNVGGAQTEAMVSAAQGVFVESVDASWDGRWYSAVQQNSDGWTVEMAIPLKSVRFKDGQDTWRLNFWRVDRELNERHVWAKVPVQFEPTDLGFTGTLIWDTPPARVGKNISITPYGLSSVSRDFQNGKPTQMDNQIGGEAKIGLSPTLNLDLTVNPDFSQADVDQQVTNLSRFSIFFPERRQFFLENADVFTNFGAFPDAPFFSRRIGLDASGQKVPIAYGVRISGNIDPVWRVGMLNMHTRGDELAPSQNYSVAALHRRVLKRSSVRGLLLNRQTFEDGDFARTNYSRNATMEFEYLSDNGKWRGKAGYNHAFKAGVTNKNQFVVASAGYNGRRFQTNWEIQQMDTNFSADMGFVGRLNNYDPVSQEIVPIGYTNISNMTDYNWFPDNKRIVRHWAGAENYVWLVGGDQFNEWYTRIRYFMFFRNTSQLRFRFNNNFVDLIFPFQITDGEPLPAGSYHFREMNVQFNTDLRRKVNLEFFGVHGSFYNGVKNTVRSSINYRAQPWGNFSLSFEMNDIQLPAPYGQTQLWLINPKMEINLSNNLFWTTFYQYNTQIGNFNINSRLQWRYRPMSDLFLVYSDNYLTEGMRGPKNRALILKLNYYFQL